MLGSLDNHSVVEEPGLAKANNFLAALRCTDAATIGRRSTTGGLRNVDCSFDID